MTALPGKSFRFPRALRLRHKQDFDLVFSEGRRCSVGPLTVHARANGQDHCRLGLAVSRRFGNAVRRNAFKRRLREAFRLCHSELPSGYDLVATARQHDIAGTRKYQQWLQEAASRIDQQCRRIPRTF